MFVLSRAASTSSRTKKGAGRKLQHKFRMITAEDPRYEEQHLKLLHSPPVLSIVNHMQIFYSSQRRQLIAFYEGDDILTSVVAHQTVYTQC